MLEELIIKHCAPTLASLKTANLFSIECSSKDALMNNLRIINSQLLKKGIVVILLKEWANKALIYVFRLSKLKLDLKNDSVRAFLRRYGYEKTDIVYVISHLKARLSECDAFPHEIGVFLGYPLYDVIGFITNGGKNSKITGFWKVYENVEEAMRSFARFSKCIEVYTRLYRAGRSVLQLTVAA